MRVSASEYVTIGVSDLDAALGLFQRRMELVVERRYRSSDSLRRAWQLDSGTRADIVELSCEGYPVGRLRLVACRPVPATKVRVHHGPEPHDAAVDIGCKAVDFYVRAPLSTAYDMVVDAGYPTRSQPVLHEVGDLVSEEFVFFGPDGVPLLFMVGHRHDTNQLRPGSPPGNYSEVATVSVVGDDEAATRDFYENVLGMNLVLRDATADDFLDGANELTGVPGGTSIRWLLYGGHGEASGKILVLHFGERGKRLTGRMHPRHLGFGLLSHRVDDLDALAERLERAGHPILTPPTNVDYGGVDERVLLARGPNEELFEFVEGTVAQRGAA